MLLGQSSFDQAQKLFAEGKFDQSQNHFSGTFKKSPSNLKANEYLGDIAGQNKNHG
jgi:hypothetical protein